MTNLRPLARQRALRALAEGAKPTLDLLADASGRSLRTLDTTRNARAGRWTRAAGGCRGAGARARGEPVEHGRGLGARAMEDGGRIDKAELDGIVAMIRGLEKIDEIMRPEEAAKKNQVKQDEDLADSARPHQ